MLTPAQKLMLDRLNNHPNPAVKNLIQRFELEPVASKEFLLNQKISERVEVIVDQIGQAPTVKRKVIKARVSPFENPDLSEFNKSGIVPF